MIFFSFSFFSTFYKYIFKVLSYYLKKNWQMFQQFTHTFLKCLTILSRVVIISFRVICCQKKRLFFLSVLNCQNNAKLLTLRNFHSQNDIKYFTRIFFSQLVEIFLFEYKVCIVKQMHMSNLCVFVLYVMLVLDLEIEIYMRCYQKVWLSFLAKLQRSCSRLMLWWKAGWWAGVC